MKISNILTAGVLAASLGLFAGAAEATFIGNSPTGAVSPTTLITFDEIVLPNNTVVTNQYSSLGITFSPELYFHPQDGTFFPSVTGNDVGNFGGPTPNPFTMTFGSAQSNVTFGMVSNSTNWRFDAYLGASLVDTGIATVFANPAEFYGFTGVTFDSIRVTSLNNDAMLLDNIAFSAQVPTPGALALLGLGLIGIGGLSRKQKAT